MKKNADISKEEKSAYVDMAKTFGENASLEDIYCCTDIFEGWIITQIGVAEKKFNSIRKDRVKIDNSQMKCLLQECKIELYNNMLKYDRSSDVQVTTYAQKGVQHKVTEYLKFLFGGAQTYMEPKYHKKWEGLFIKAGIGYGEDDNVDYKVLRDASKPEMKELEEIVKPLEVEKNGENDGRYWISNFDIEEIERLLEAMKNAKRKVENEGPYRLASNKTRKVAVKVEDVAQYMMMTDEEIKELQGRALKKILYMKDDREDDKGVDINDIPTYDEYPDFDDKAEPKPDSFDEGRELKGTEAILAMLKILYEETDEDNSISKAQLVHIMKDKYNAKRSDDTLKKDMNIFASAGLIVETDEKDRYAYQHTFSFEELKFMLEAVQANKFMSTKQTQKLTQKIINMASAVQRKSLKKGLRTEGVARNEDTEIMRNYRIVDKAFIEEKKILFKYCAWNEKKNLEYVHDGKLYSVTPVNLMIENGMLYLFGVEDENPDILKTFRMDKIKNMELSPELRLNSKVINKNKLRKETFSMYGGEEMKVKLKSTKKGLNVLIDRFGTDNLIVPDQEAEGMYEFTNTVRVSPTFYGWIFGLGDNVEIVYPEKARNEFADMIERAKEKYERKNKK